MPQFSQRRGVSILVALTVPLVASLITVAVASGAEAEVAMSRLQFEVNDADGDAVPCRIHLFDPAGKPLQANGLPFWKDHFVCTGRVALALPPGTYRYEIERGPEYEPVAGEIALASGRDETITAALRRITDLKSLGWYGGDLHVHRPSQDVPLLMRAEDLHVAQVITWWNQKNPWTSGPPDEPLQRADRDRFFHVLGGEDERGGGALLYFHLPKPLDIVQAKREFPSSLTYLKQARETYPAAWVDIEKPFWWDVPAWLASGQVDSIGLANNHMCRSQMYVSEAWGKPRDKQRLPDPLGNGHWTQEIYYHALNCGLRLPPSAGSASGVLPNPVGYNRVYVHTGQGKRDDRLDYDDWWQNLKAGRSFVTNGPLLLVRANGELPGHVFQTKAPHNIKLEITLTSCDQVPRIEIIQSGQIVRTLDCADKREQQLTVELPVSDSGWFLVRAIADNPRTFRFASTAPYYVELGDAPQRVSRRSAQFFRSWIDERIEQLEAALTDTDQRREVVGQWEPARTFWQHKLDTASAE